MYSIRVLVVDDLKDIRDYFSMILNNEPDIEVVGTASSGKEAILIAEKLKPDIILMDVQMESEFAGIQAIESICDKDRDVKIIVLTIHEDDETLYRAYASGAMDFIVKTSSIVDIINSIKNVHKNKLQLRPEVAEKILDEFTRMKRHQRSLIFTLNIISKLTNAEYEILREVYLGNTYRKIAKKRMVEEVTIRSQANKIIKKFEKRNMKEIVNLLKQLKIFEIYK